ncbi:MAG TPA: M48 family metalloprotease [Syntrophales bacterium]|nr:M48 family metalloprotease [Syntrophales bacterium]
MNQSDIFKKKGWIIPIIILFILFQATSLTYASFTIEDEKKLGKEFYEKLEKSNVLIHDKKVSTYVNQVGNKVLAQSNKAPFDFHFSIIDSSAINAFATPGGYVYVNRGLINIVEKESELASVLGHEIGHVNARHIASIIEKSQKIGIATLAAMLAGAFLGGGGDLSAAAVAFSVATATTLNLKYSRENEEEADRLGMYYLVSAGYDGSAMLDFMKKMRKYEFYSSNIPSYFLTHPGTDERITYIDALLHTTYTHKGAESIIGNLTRTQTFLILRDRDLDSGLKHFQSILQKNQNNVDALYGIAVIQDRLGRTNDSLTNFHKALSLAPDDEDISRDLGIAYFKLGRTSEAINILRKALTINEDDSDTILYLGRSYELQGDYTTALNIYKKIEKKNIDDIDVYYSIAIAYGKTNDPGDSHYNFGIYFKKKNKMDSALFHFKEALKYFPNYSEKYQEIEQEIKSIASRDKPPDAIQRGTKRRGNLLDHR